MKILKKLVKKEVNYDPISKVLKKSIKKKNTVDLFDLECFEKCLCIAPHADDESIGMGGTLAKHPHKFKVVLVTDGYRGLRSLPKKEAKRVRADEFKSAMTIAGIKDYNLLGIPDRDTIDNYKTFSQLDVSEFDCIFIPNLVDLHGDHKAMSVLLKELLKEKGYKPGLKIAFYEVWSALGTPNFCVDITNFIEHKKNMLNSHASQMALVDYHSAAIGLNRYRGLVKSVKYAEAFDIISAEEFIELAEDVFLCEKIKA